MRKKWWLLSLSALFALLLIAGCGSDTKETTDTPDEGETSQSDGESETTSFEPGSYEDGLYFAQEDDFSENSGWKYMVTLEVEDGEIVSAEWNGAHKNGGVDKITSSSSGEYGMVENGDAQSEWHEQAELTEAYLLETQDPTAIEYSSDEGHTDAISGVSIHVAEFFDLAKEALANGPVERGMYKDGAYYAEEDDFSEDSGWKYTASLTVVNGYIVAADWNGIHEDGGDDKDTVSANGEYGMVENGGAQSEWHEQAELAEAYLLETQDPTAIEYTSDDGHTDAISGVTIHVSEFFELAEAALADAK
ncbi:FMN-binding protein [Amphibacillus sp. MSJ-3]|uniref:FMN-binding protein n=1 Tax=Amphibacillus sp. MSJ-3 TaxID=2841505 RepID=UPI001C0ED0B4|nr:FMN-binding protein [Amphibacillus sp. MSJ-3]MBU5595554.1 FMN-binding protein [Amphibacillus sp. MSJ-3]